VVVLVAFTRVKTVAEFSDGAISFMVYFYCFVRFSACFLLLVDISVINVPHFCEINCVLPLKRGSSFQTDIGPRDENCPTAISMKNKGRPAVTSIITYGIKKLAENTSNKLDLWN